MGLSVAGAVLLLLYGSVHGQQEAAEKQCCPLSRSSIFGVLTHRPEQGDKPVDAPKGLMPLDLNTVGKDGYFYVPETYSPDAPAPLIVLLHGARGTGEKGLMTDFSKVKEIASDKGAILVAPDSRGTSWDVLRGGFGPDVAYIDEALKKVFTQYNIDSSHICLAGFSDGGTYAYSLGITNGDLFTHIMSFSPGGLSPARAIGKPKVFDSHGTSDEILPIDKTSRFIVPLLKRQGYDVTYVEFDGTHYIPDNIAEQAMEWFL